MMSEEYEVEQPAESQVPAAPEPIVAEPAPVAEPSESLQDIVDRWFRVGFPGSVVMETSEQVRFLHDQVEHLKSILPSK